MADLERILKRLSIGAAEWASRAAADRGEVAIRTARSTASVADDWIEHALTIKGATSSVAAIRAEETATGPLATLRLLLVTAGSLGRIDREGLPRLASPPRWIGGEGAVAAQVEVDVLPARGPRGSIFDEATFGGHQARVRCAGHGGLEAFERAWRVEVERRPRTGGVAVVLGAGNVTGLGPGDCLCQIFEHGRAALLKLHPLHAPLESVLRRALAPLIEEGMLEIVAGGPELARVAIASPEVSHVHLTGGFSAFEALAWGGGDRSGPPRLEKSMTCELGNVSPWIVVPGKYTDRALSRQADIVAASIVNNTSFNCIATKLIVTARSWQQRGAFLAAIQRRLASMPARPGWYPGSSSAWETVAGMTAPEDGTLPWVFRTGVDPEKETRWVEREWFLPAVAEIPLGADSVEAFCSAAMRLVDRLPGSLAASVTVPGSSGRTDAERVERLVRHLRFGVVAVNTWSAIGYSLGSVPWGGFPGGTLADPKSGIGFVHDPLFLPLVHNTILRAPLVTSLQPAWFPWHPHAATLARGMVDVYDRIARGGLGLWPLLRMLPAVWSRG